MADNKLTQQIPRQSVIYIALCSFGLLILILGGIVPSYRSSVAADGEIAGLKGEIAEQKALAPVFTSLKKQSEKKETGILRTPVREKLPPTKISSLPDVFRQAASMNGLTMVSTTPDLNDMGGSTQFVSVDVVLRGNIAAFRKFIIHVGGIPYVDHIEKLEVQVEKDYRQFKAVFLISIG